MIHGAGDLRPQPLATTAVVALLLVVATPADAYIGPGAGFAVLGSFVVLFATTLLAGFAILAWPFRTLWRMIRHRSRTKPHVRRLIFVGFDGQDAAITERLMAEGKLPNLTRLAERGCYRRLRTTFPSISPVAWSSFTTGTNPGRHNIFDFLDRDPRTYLPRLSSTHIGIRRPLPQARHAAHSARQAGAAPAAQVQALVDGARRAQHLEHGPPGADHLSARHASTAPSSAPCASPTCSAPRGRSSCSRPAPETTRFKEGGLRSRSRAGRATPCRGAIQGPENTFLDGNPPMEIPLTSQLDRDAGARGCRSTASRCELKPGDSATGSP